ncbi:MAG: EF-hand domain-containing protein [Verrucomicrobiota bacterium]|nr:EF-hand domain-containing protein [Verrucomicrobiota bacterium]
MNKTVITLILGLSLAMAGFAQKSPRLAKDKPTVTKPALSTPIEADDRDRADSSNSKPDMVEPPRPTSKPTIVKANPKPSQLVAALDANKDGKLSFKEIEAAVEILKKLDTNKNGELTLNEFGIVPEAKKQSRGSLSNLGETKPNLSARPNGRPSSRPSARRISKSSSTTTRMADSKNTSPRKTRPSRRPSRLITKKIPGATALTDTRATGAVETATGNQKRTVRTAPARKKSKSASRRRPTIKPAVSQKSAKLKLLLMKAKSLTQKIEQSMEGIKNPGKSRAAAIWVSKDSKELISSLEEELKKGREIDSNILLNAEKKLIDTEKLLE